jgi:hypothetical protein
VQQILASEIAAAPESEAKIKADMLSVEQFLLSGVVQRAELGNEYFCSFFHFYLFICIFRYVIQRNKVGSGGFGTCHRGMCLRMPLLSAVTIAATLSFTQMPLLLLLLLLLPPPP